MLNAVMCVWNEEDIIEATVKHAFAQGCDNVYIVDNGSTDNTVRIAVKAGAKLAIQFKSKYFNEREKIAHLNAVVQCYTSKAPEDYVWWLYIDADEFPQINGGIQIKDFVNALGTDIVGIQGFMFEHIPTHPPYYIEGYHPIDFMPLCTKTAVSKKPLVKYEKNKPHMYSAGGAHEFDTHDKNVYIISDAINIHHFPIRRPEYTLKRLKKLLYRSKTGISRIDWYDKKSKIDGGKDKSHYHSRYKYIQEVFKNNKYKSLKIHTLPYNYAHSYRWCTPSCEVQDTFLCKFDKLICQALYSYFSENYDIALFRFNDAFNICKCEQLKLWIMIKMAESFSSSETESAQALLDTVKQSHHSDIIRYISNHEQDIIYKKNKTVKKENVDALEIRIQEYCCELKVDRPILYDRMKEIVYELG